jgi:hypothetical protein
VKVPVPVPSVVLEFAVVGLAVVAQHTPLEVTADPPSAMIFPPDVAVVKVIELAAVVVRVGITSGVVVKNTSLP